MISSRVRLTGFVLLSISLLLNAVWQLDMRSDMSDFFFSDDGGDKAFQISKINADELQERVIAGVFYQPSDESQSSVFLDELKVALQQLSGVERLWSRTFSDGELQQLLNVYAPYQIQLLSLNPERDIPRLISDEQLQQRANRILSLLTGPGPEQVKSLIGDDPMLLSLDWLERIGEQYQSGLTAPGFSAFFLQLDSGAEVQDTSILLQNIQAVFEQLNADYNDAFELVLTGVPVFETHIRNTVSQDVQMVSLLSIGLILFLFIAVFRSLAALLLTTVLLLCSVSTAVLVTQWVFSYVHGLTLALGSTLIGVCIDYFIHVMMHCGACSAADNIARVKRIWPSLIMGGVTTILGYIALGASGFPGLQQIAVFSASGIVVALLMARYLIPQLMVAAHVELRPVIDLRALHRRLAFPASRWLLGALVVMVFALGWQGIDWRDELERLAPDLSSLRADDQRVREKLSPIEPGRFIITQGRTLEQALQRNEGLQERLDKLQAQGILDRYYSVYPWVASAEAQLRNIDVWNQLFDEQRKRAWANALFEAGLSPQGFSLPPGDRPALLEPGDLEDSPAFSLLQRQLVSGEQQVQVLTWLAKHDAAALQSALEGMEGVRYFSQKDQVNAMSRAYRERASWMLLWGAVAIVLLMALLFRSWRDALRVSTPAMLSVLFVLGLWGLAGQAMGMLHLMGLLLAAAISVDYSIFYYKNARHQPDLTFRAISLSALTSVASFASLGVAQNPALQALAWTVAPGIISGYLLCPAMLSHSIGASGKLSRGAS